MAILVVLALIVGFRLKQAHDERLARKEALKRQYESARSFLQQIDQVSSQADRASHAMDIDSREAVEAGQRRHDSDDILFQDSQVKREVRAVAKMRDDTDTQIAKLRSWLDLFDARYGDGTTRAARRDLDGYALAEYEMLQKWTDAAASVADETHAAVNGGYYSGSEIQTNYEAAESARDRAKVRISALMQDAQVLVNRGKADEARYKQAWLVAP